MNLVQLNGWSRVERVNPAQVTRLTPAYDVGEGLTKVYFAGDAWIVVRHDMEDAITRLGFSEVTL